MIDNKTVNLKMELVLQMDWKIITETIYQLEGDGFLSIMAYDKLMTIKRKGDSTACKNIITTANDLQTLTMLSLKHQ